MEVNRPLFDRKPFASVESLARALSVPLDELIRVSHETDGYYYLAKRIKKADGSFREVFGVRDPLRAIQKKVLRRIFRSVQYPRYLMGSIRDREYPRDYMRNAQQHSGSSILMQEDVERFFPSIRRAQVLEIFQFVFKLPRDVAECLTRICVRGEEVVQGAATSSYIANLVFWRYEPELVIALRKRGFRYSRLVDDINVSAQRRVSKCSIGSVVGNVQRMIRLAGFKTKREKHQICSPGMSMVIHGLNVDRRSPQLTKLERSRIRAAVHQLKVDAARSPGSRAMRASLVSLNSRIAIWHRLSPRQAKKYRDAVKALMEKYP